MLLADPAGVANQYLGIRFGRCKVVWTAHTCIRVEARFFSNRCAEVFVHSHGIQAHDLVSERVDFRRGTTMSANAPARGAPFQVVKPKLETASFTLAI